MKSFSGDIEQLMSSTDRRIVSLLQDLGVEISQRGATAWPDKEHSCSQQSVQQTHSRISFLNGYSHHPQTRSIHRSPFSLSLSPVPLSFSVTLRNSLHSKSMHAIYRGTLCQGEQMYKINIRAVCARRRAMIPESHKSGRWESRGGHPPPHLALGGSTAEERRRGKGEGENTTPRTFTLLCFSSLCALVHRSRE